MAVSVVQRGVATDNTGATGSVSVAFGSNVTAGNTIIAVCVGASMFIPRDTLGNTYAIAYQNMQGATSTHNIKVYTAANIFGGANTVTVSDGSSIAGMFVYEVAGLANSRSFDKAMLTRQTSATTDTTGTTEVTSFTNELALAVFSYNGSTAITYTAGAGYTNLQFPAGVNGFYICCEEQVLAATGAQTATVTQSVAGNGIVQAALVTFADTSSPRYISRPFGVLRPHPFSPGIAR